MDNQKYIILADSQKKAGEKIALVDRLKYKTQWWTESKKKAMVFTTLEQAKIQLGKLKFNNPKIYTEEKGMTFLKEDIIVTMFVEYSESTMGRMLREKEMQWHDDDWYEGMND